MQDTDKFEIHYRQQLSALIDGELSAEESRFMVRRLEHDAELSGRQERWQLLGDVLRGAACAPAPADFAGRVAAAVAAEPLPASSVSTPRRGWRWGGGMAIAASLAALALFMTRERLPGEAVPPPVDAPATVVASVAQVPAPAHLPAKPAPADPAGELAAAVPAVALAAAARRQDGNAPRRSGSATRTRQAARGLAGRQAEPERQLASAAPAQPVTSPFAHPAALQAKPWPRSALSADSPLNASFSPSAPGATFYPFEPGPVVPVQAPVLPRQP